MGVASGEGEVLLVRFPSDEREIAEVKWKLISLVLAITCITVLDDSLRSARKTEENRTITFALLCVYEHRCFVCKQSFDIELAMYVYIPVRIS